VKKSLLILPLVLLASALALTACGGGSTSSGSDEEAAIEEAIETSATSSDPSKCSEVQTEGLNETETGKTGQAALEACETEAEEETGQPESVTVTQVEIEKEEAAAEVAIEGGALNGQAIAVGLQKEEGDWKVDAYIGFTRYDPAGIAAAFEEKLGEEEGVSAELAACISEGVAEMSRDEAQLLFFEKNKEGFEEITESCKG